MQFNSKFTSNSRPLERFQFAHNLYVIFISHKQLHFPKVINIMILTKLIKIGQAGNNVDMNSKQGPLYLNTNMQMPCMFVPFPREGLHLEMFLQNEFIS